ncbi:pyridoxamine 5'-phosphate oxidase [Roseovarius sp. LXJ103]|uniref:pyridoxamine 5'-phosphate oxidase n=1 Tax=Roseovarius carneus TaxID=2853164 RepID=UPI000D607119|nr:pyridoxamine 5'-phosphate oxidase [Roseovarius carneus]MBZ8119575.1 pyridoxamine 5'-phosphate oxidase [Roseovarius carneus]PWE34802.1 pyridoxamine 5'-phosphate oxidase [Pelagicola sp. LXJ1103]
MCCPRPILGARLILKGTPLDHQGPHGRRFARARTNEESKMSDRSGKFAGDDPFEIARRWLTEAEVTEVNDPNAIALASVDAEGLPNVRMVLLKEVAADGFIFYTNYDSAKGQELQATGKAGFVMHWKSLRRQVRVRGTVARFEGPEADEYYASRSLKSRLGAWASEQSRPLSGRTALMAEVAKVTARFGTNPPRPPFWGGFKITPSEIEFWADGDFRLHDRFVWRRDGTQSDWRITRLNP